MSFIKRFVTHHIHAAAAQRPSGQEAVAVFFHGPAPAAEAIAALVPAAQSSVQEEDSKTRLVLTWPDVSLTITMDRGWDRETQLTGLRGWMERFPARARAQPRVQALMASLDQVTACYGTVCTPGLDADNKVVSLLQQLLGDSGGFFFSRNSFYAPDGAYITGLDEDPAWLGTPPPTKPHSDL